MTKTKLYTIEILRFVRCRSTGIVQFPTRFVDRFRSVDNDAEQDESSSEKCNSQDSDGNPDAQSGSLYGSNETDYSNRDSFLKHILYNKNGLLEIEIHQLAYLYNRHCVREGKTDHRLDVSFTPDHHGTFSLEISEGLLKLTKKDEISEYANMYDGTVIACYDRDNEFEELNGEFSSLIEDVLDEVEENASNVEDLIEMTRTDEARKATETDEVIDLKRHYSDENTDSRAESTQ